MYESDKIKEIVQKELTQQRFGVFNTIRNEAPHSTLVCYATTEDLTQIFFFTPKNSRKFINSQIYENVSFFVDTATNSPEDITDAITISANGRTQIGSNLEPEKLEEYKSVFLKKNPFLKEFVSSASTDIVIINVEKYEVVRSFQTVIVWTAKEEDNQELDVRQIMGQSVVNGISRGKVRVILEESDFKKVNEDEIIVLKTSEKLEIPDSLITLGIVGEYKQPSNSATKFAKSKSIPYVVNIEEATDIISNGDNITIDGFLGFITLHKIK